MLAWLLGLTLALHHRIGHAVAEPGEPHHVGGLHQDEASDCRLVDQTGLGEALLPAVGHAAPALAAAVSSAPMPARRARAASRRPYQARAPPRG